MEEFRPYKETTVDGFIDAGENLDISESTMSFKNVIDDSVVLAYHNVITKFYRVLSSFIVEITLSDEEFDRYIQQPKKYCYEMYGTPELAYSLLYINDMPSVTDFKRKKIKVFTDDIMDAIVELMSLNEEDLEKESTTME